MTNNASRFDEMYGIVRYPLDTGAIVEKFQNRPLIPDELWNHSDLIYQSVAGTSELTDKTIDRSGIDPDSELAALMEEHWSADFS